jgi:hypothetical protein
MRLQLQLHNPRSQHRARGIVIWLLLLVQSDYDNKPANARG